MGARIPAAVAILLALGGGAEADSSRTRSARIRRFLLSVPGEGVFLVDLKGETLWSHRCDPYDAIETRQGQVLISDRRTGRVFLINREGQRVWESGPLLGPVNAEPLDNGNVLVVENDSGRVLELTSEGAVLRGFDGHRTPFDARRRANGNTVVADSGGSRIVEYDAQGRKVRETAGLKFPNGLSLLPDGGTLFTTYTTGTIGELDASGGLRWEHKIGGTLYSIAVEGETFWVADGTGGRVVQVNRAGATLREIKLGKTFVDLAFCR